METQNKLEELKIRADNLQMVIDIAQQELNCLLQEIKELQTVRPIWYKIPKEKPPFS